MKLLVREIKEFTKGGNPFKTLNIGKRAQIENWFETWAPYVKYRIDENLKIYIEEDLGLYESKVTSLPDNLHIRGFLYIEKSKITSLPDNLHIEGFLYLKNTKVISLPDNLHVGESLDIEGTKIISLPEDLYVGKKIYKDF